MVLADLPMVLIRRWYVVLVGLMVTAFLGFQAYAYAPPTFTSTAEVLLLPPPTSVPQGGNPYLSLDGLAPAGDILAKAMSDEASAMAIAAQGATGKFLVTPDGSAAAPLLLVTSESSNSEESQSTLDVVLTRIPLVLKQVQEQAKVPSNALIGTTVVTRTDQPAKSLKPVLRAVGLAAAAGVTLTLLIVALLDGYLNKRQAAARAKLARRKRLRGAQVPGSGPDSLDSQHGSPTQELARRGVSRESLGTASILPDAIKPRAARGSEPRMVPSFQVHASARRTDGDGTSDRTLTHDSK